MTPKDTQEAQELGRDLARWHDTWPSGRDTIRPRQYYYVVRSAYEKARASLRQRERSDQAERERQYREVRAQLNREAVAREALRR